MFSLLMASIRMAAVESPERSLNIGLRLRKLSHQPLLMTDPLLRRQPFFSTYVPTNVRISRRVFPSPMSEACKRWEDSSAFSSAVRYGLGPCFTPWATRPLKRSFSMDRGTLQIGSFIRGNISFCGCCHCCFHLFIRPLLSLFEGTTFGCLMQPRTPSESLLVWHASDGRQAMI